MTFGFNQPEIKKEKNYKIHTWCLIFNGGQKY